MRYDDEKDLKYIPKGAYFDADMSEEDKALVQTLQDAWSTYSAKGDQQGMDTAHRQAESIRAKYGYSGGADGSDYIEVPKIQTGEQFSYTSAPQYVSRWQTLIDQAANSILNREAFSYDHTQDPLYQQLNQSYTQKGQQAMEDTLGIVSQRTGGLASSYATQAGQQAYNGYMGELADKIPELRQLAYAMYMDEGDQMRANLEMLQGMENQNYNQYLDRLNQFNTDRNFQYGVNRDAVSDQRYADEWQYQKDRDTVADQRYSNETAYGKERDALSRNRYDAETLAQYGDFSGYKALGYTDEQIAAMQSAYLSEGNDTYEPSLTWPQVKAEIEAGNLTDGVLQAYKYYMGAEYEEPVEYGGGYSETPTATGTGGYTPSEWNYVLNNIRTNLREGNEDAVSTYMDQIADGLSAEQWSQIEALLKQYNF